MKKLITLILIALPLSLFGQIKISQLTEATTFNTTDLFLLTKGDASRKVQYSVLKQNILSPFNTPLRMNYSGDTTRMWYNGSYTQFSTSKDSFKFNKPLSFPNMPSSSSGSGSFEYTKVLDSVLYWQIPDSDPFNGMHLIGINGSYDFALMGVGSHLYNYFNDGYSAIELGGVGTAKGSVVLKTTKADGTGLNSLSLDSTGLYYNGSAVPLISENGFNAYMQNDYGNVVINSTIEDDYLVVGFGAQGKGDSNGYTKSDTTKTELGFTTSVGGSVDNKFIIDKLGIKFNSLTSSFNINTSGDLSNSGDITPGGRLMIPMGEISYFNLTGTTVTISGASDGSSNMVKVGPTTTLNNDMDFDNGGSNNGRLRYIGTTTRTFHVACTISYSAASANQNGVFGIAKNGTVVTAGKILPFLGLATDTRSAALHLMVTLSTNDYLELYVGNTTASNNIIIKTLNLFAMGM